MITLTTIFSIAIFTIALWKFGVIRVGSGVFIITKDALALIRDENLDDTAREKAAQRISLRLFGTSMSILLRTALALAVSFMPIWLADKTGFVKTEDVFLYLSRWDVILIASAVITIGYLTWIRKRTFN